MGAWYACLLYNSERFLALFLLILVLSFFFFVIFSSWFFSFLDTPTSFFYLILLYIHRINFGGNTCKVKKEEVRRREGEKRVKNGPVYYLVSLSLLLFL